MSCHLLPPRRLHRDREHNDIDILDQQSLPGPQLSRSTSEHGIHACKINRRSHLVEDVEHAGDGRGPELEHGRTVRDMEIGSDQRGPITR